MNLSIRKLFVTTIAFIIPLSFMAPKLGAQVGPAGVKKVMVLDFYDKTKKKVDYKTADLVRNQLRKWAKFSVLSKKATLATYRKYNISRRKMLTKSYRRQVAKYLGVDAVVYGVIEPGTKTRYVLSTKMEKTSNGKIVRLSKLPFNKYIGPKASYAVAKKFLGSKYKRSVARTYRKKPAPIAPVDNYTVNTPPEPGPPLDDLAGRTIPEEEDDVPGWVAPEEGKEAKDEDKGDRKKAKFLTKEDKAVTDETPKRNWLTLKFSPALLKNSYSVKNPAGSAVENIINISTGFFPSMNFVGEWWFLDFLGIDTFFNYGFLTLSVTPPGGTAFSVKTKVYSMGGNVKYRYHFLKEEKSPYVLARAGFQLSKFSPGDQSAGGATPILSGTKYTDITVGIGSRVPFWFLESLDLGFNFNFDYFVVSRLSESFINNGLSNSSKGFQFSAGPYWKFYKMFMASFEIAYTKHSASFSNPDPTQGSRTDVVAGAKSNDSTLGMLFFVGIDM